MRSPFPVTDVYRSTGLGWNWLVIFHDAQDCEDCTVSYGWSLFRRRAWRAARMARDRLDPEAA